MKIHTRLKRKYALTSSFRHTKFFSGDDSTKNGPKTFTSEKGAKEWAEKAGIKKYNLVPAKKGKKFKVEAV